MALDLKHHGIFKTSYSIESAYSYSNIFVVTCRLGDPDALPKAAAAAIVGMRPGGRRRVLVPPRGWASDKVRTCASTSVKHLSSSMFNLLVVVCEHNVHPVR